MKNLRPNLIVLYHFFHPDDVVSARHLSDFAAGMAARGWDVEARPCNRGCRDENVVYSPRELWNGVEIRRAWRPRFKQASAGGRILNALWMIGAWSSVVFRSPQPDVLLVGTDPILSVLVAGLVKWIRPRIKIAHWAFDLYPEAAVADGLLQAGSWPVKMLEGLLAKAYRSCDLIADLGPCMRERLAAYGLSRAQVTLVPWALVEPESIAEPDPAIRAKLFGEDAKLTLLYSGNFGRAHSYREFLALARRLRNTDIEFCFAVRGNRAAELRSAVTDQDRNIRFSDFIPEAELEGHLSAADIHLASLTSAWTGAVVPSKFFGSLAAGRPVLFAGDERAAIARWAGEHNIGWVLNDQNVDATAELLFDFASDRSKLLHMRQRCRALYHERFSFKSVMNGWERELRCLIAGDCEPLPLAAPRGSVP